VHLRADLLRHLVAKLPNLTDFYVDHFHPWIYDVLGGLACPHGLRVLSLISGESASCWIDPVPLPKLLSNFPNLDSLVLCNTARGSPTKLGDTLASMPRLTHLVFWNALCVDGSCATPFSSGGLSAVSLDECPSLDSDALDAILTVNGDTLKHLNLNHVPGRANRHQLSLGPQYKLKRLETLCMTNMSADEVYLLRFASSPIRIREVSPPTASQITHPGGQTWTLLATDWESPSHRRDSPLDNRPRVIVSDAQISGPDHPGDTSELPGCRVARRTLPDHGSVGFHTIVPSF
jgi:hypothetical protein